MHSKPSTLEPQAAWQPFRPSLEEPWDRRRVAHLYRRAAFGCNREELGQGLTRSPEEVVDRLLAADRDSDAFDRQMESLAGTVVAGGDPQGLTAWWLYRLVHTPAPLRENVTLFWHGHFATSAAKVRSARLMYAQNQLLRRHALGPFEELVQGISRDPAMLIYLDSTTNRRIHPNENYARELMELFCLGLDEYTEQDIQELARCFTGWEVDQERFRFNRFQHDPGEKKLLGQSGRFGGEEGVRIVLAQAAAPRFIARKLVRYFVCDDEVPEEVIAPLADELRENDFAIEPTVRRILTSRLFFSERSLGRKIRSPVELAVGLLRSLQATTGTKELAAALRPLGQTLFYPPSVKGWDGGRTWINATTLLGRANVVRHIVDSPSTEFAGGSLAALAEKHQLSDASAVVDWVGGLLLAVPLDAAVRKSLAELAAERAPDRHRQLADTIHAISILPEFQLS